MVISHRWRTARKAHYCDGCETTIHPGVFYLALFGNSYRGEPCYAMRICWDCEAERADMVGGEKD